MRVAVISDTHGMTDFIINEINNRKDIDYIIHLGDHAWDAKLISEKTGINTVYVKGNNDFGSDAIEDKVIYLDGHKIFMTHGHRYGVYFGIDSIYYKAKSLNADIALYGHTHAYYKEESDNLLILNPGALSYSRGDAYTSYVVMDLEKDSIKTERILEK